MLFNKNSFLSLIKFYFLILYENLPKDKESKEYINQLFVFFKTMDNIFGFITYCLTKASDVIFEDYNVLDEVVNSDDSMIYN